VFIYHAETQRRQVIARNLIVFFKIHINFEDNISCLTKIYRTRTLCPRTEGSMRSWRPLRESNLKEPLDKKTG